MLQWTLCNTLLLVQCMKRVRLDCIIKILVFFVLQLDQSQFDSIVSFSSCGLR